jgi:signal peptidase II
MASKGGRGGPGMLHWLGLAMAIILIDQFTKILILGYYRLGDSTYITSFFNVVRVHNSGAAFSFLANAGGWQRWFFTALGLAAAAFIVWMLRAHGGQRLFAFALSCILGGALGNVIDRLAHGYVVDMLDFHWRFLSPVFPGGHFPAFNLADAAISLGAICMILDEILRVRRSR